MYFIFLVVSSRGFQSAGWRGHPFLRDLAYSSILVGSFLVFTSGLSWSFAVFTSGLYVRSLRPVFTSGLCLFVICLLDDLVAVSRLSERFYLHGLFHRIFTEYSRNDGPIPTNI